MSEHAESDPERLLAEALRAQARSAPARSQPAPPGDPTDVLGNADDSPQTDDGLPHGYGLLSGTGASSLERERAALDPLPTSNRTAQADEPKTVEHDIAGGATPQAPLAARWVLLLAVVLGLAAGAVVGLLTLL
jgi:hypothetical protein